MWTGRRNRSGYTRSSPPPPTSRVIFIDVGGRRALDPWRCRTTQDVPCEPKWHSICISNLRESQECSNAGVGWSGAGSIAFVGRICQRCLGRCARLGSGGASSGFSDRGLRQRKRGGVSLRVSPASNVSAPALNVSARVPGTAIAQVQACIHYFVVFHGDGSEEPSSPRR